MRNLWIWTWTLPDRPLMSDRVCRLALVSGSHGSQATSHMPIIKTCTPHTRVCRHVHVHGCGTGAHGFMSVIIDVRTGPALDCGAPGSGTQVRTLRV